MTVDPARRTRTWWRGRSRKLTNENGSGRWITAAPVVAACVWTLPRSERPASVVGGTRCGGDELEWGKDRSRLDAHRSTLHLAAHAQDRTMANHATSREIGTLAHERIVFDLRVCPQHYATRRLNPPRKKKRAGYAPVRMSVGRQAFLFSLLVRPPSSPLPPMRQSRKRKRRGDITRPGSIDEVLADRVVIDVATQGDDEVQERSRPTAS